LSMKYGLQVSFDTWRFLLISIMAICRLKGFMAVGP